MTSRFVTLALTSFTSPPSSQGTLPAMRHLAALAMLIVEKTDEGQWRFALRSEAVGAGHGEDRLLAWATESLPESGIAIGWKLAQDVVEPLLSATTECDAEVAPPFLDRLIGLVTAPSIDISVTHGGVGAPSLDEAAAQRGIATRVLSDDAIASAWATGDRDLLRRHARAQAVAAWRVWLADAPVDEFPAKTEFLRWLSGADRQP